MKNNSLYSLMLFFLLFDFSLKAQELEINSSKVRYDNVNKVSIFEGNVNSIDSKGNKLFSEYAKYNKLEDIIETKGDTKIVTSAGYEVFGSDIIFNNKKSVIYSNNPIFS
jgi:lipopolysaccharide assembly outer membrane protein LptD (OstA)